MDAISSPPEAKMQKIMVAKDAVDGEDIISKLPDNILHYILAFLPIKDFLRTSVLSKRWQYLGMSISEVDFDENDYQLESSMQYSFLDSVDRIMLLHDSSSIRKFRLILHMNTSALRLNSWVCAAINHKVQELDLSIPITVRVVLPVTLFTSESLQQLKLEIFSVFKLPSLICFQNLKTLHLTVSFSDDESPQKLFSGCPILEELVLYNCDWRQTERVTLSIPTLKSLTIYYDPLFPNDPFDCTIRLFAENLASLKCISYLIFELLLCDVSSLVDAYIEVVNSRLRRRPHRALKLVDGVRHVKSLTLSNDTLDFVSGQEGNLQDSLPIFNDLTRLTVNYGMSDYINRALICFLHKSPNLEYLHIDEGFDPADNWQWETVPYCFKSSLKEVSVSNFHGFVSEVNLLEHLVEDVKFLERLTIYCLEDFGRDLAKQTEIYHQLQLLHRGSDRFMIEFIKD